MALSARAEKAVEILKAGGYFRKQLETQYRGGEKFQMRLRDAQHQIVKGFGFQTYFELTDAQMLQWRECVRSSAYPEEYVIRAE
jgi:hypothetical protein